VQPDDSESPAKGIRLPRAALKPNYLGKGVSMKSRMKTVKMWAIVTKSTREIARDRLRNTPCLYFTRENAMSNRVPEDGERVERVVVSARQ